MRPSPILSLIALSLTATACVDNESSLFIRGVYRMESDCTAIGDAGAVLLAQGRLDRALTSEYIGALVVGNQLVSRGAPDQIRTETARVALRGAEVTLRNIEGDKIGRDFTVDGTGFVDPGAGNEPGYGILFARLITSAESIPQDDEQIIVNVKVFGRTLGGREIESNTLMFPVAICTGCLIDYPADANLSTGGAAYRCGAEAEEELETPCFFGQDQVVDCRTCAQTEPACQSPFWQNP